MTSTPTEPTEPTPSDPEEDLGTPIRETVLQARMEAIRFTVCKTHGLPLWHCTECWPL